MGSAATAVVGLVVGLCPVWPRMDAMRCALSARLKRHGLRLAGTAAIGEGRAFQWHGPFSPVGWLLSFVGAIFAQRGSYGIPWDGPGPGFAVQFSDMDKGQIKVLHRALNYPPSN